MRAQLAIVVALAFVVAACGGSGPASPAAASPAPPASAETAGERMTRLYEAAKAEGKIAFYSSMNTDDARTIIPKFEQRFPGLKIEHTRVTGEQLVTRVITEVRAGQNLFDIFDSSSFQVKQIVDLGYTQPYTPSASEDIPPEGRDAKGTWIANRGVPLAIGFNTQKGVKVGDIKGWADLCDKKYESKIAVEVASFLKPSPVRDLDSTNPISERRAALQRPVAFESVQQRRAKGIAAEGEFQASERLKDAAAVMATEPITLQLRYLQTLAEIATENNSTTIFPIPVELLKAFVASAERK